MHLPNHISYGICLFIIFAGVVSAEEGAISAQDREFFEKKIRPVLVKHCYECHAEDSKELGGKLLLDSRSGMRKGGESGPSVIAEKPDESLIIQALRYESFEMPPDAPLPEAVIHDFVHWVSKGAPDPRVKEVVESSLDPLDPETLWSFYPRSSPEIPAVQLKEWGRDPIDLFVLEKLEKKNLAPTEDASPRILIRRLYYDLIGLPPTLEQVQDYESDFERSGEQATERLVDHLLNSPQFGERWGRHWLDVARYGESNGDDGLGRNASFPHAWRYRDYVIDAINEDVPYNRFLTEQIAGDLLPASSAEQRNRQLIATGFLAIGSKPAVAMNKNFAMDIVDDQINAVSTAVMGLSVACARCHDHKHDPIPTKDYYAMAGIFSNTETLYGLAGNEKLTAPPTELIELSDNWQPANEAEKKASRKTLKFPDEYEEALQKLEPIQRESFTNQPQGLNTNSDVKYSDSEFAAVKDVTFTGTFPSFLKSYSVSLWFKNETKNSERPITAYLFSHAKMGDKSLAGDHVGIGGKHDKSRTGKLFIFNGKQNKKSIAGSTVIKEGTWNHVVLTREADQVQVYLNGVTELADKVPPQFGKTLDFCIANRSDNFSPLTGNVAEFALFDRALSAEEAEQLHDASGQPRGTPPPYGVAMGVREKQKIVDCKVHINGDIGKLGPQVPRGILTAYEQVSYQPEKSFPQAIEIPEDTSGRLELAEWLTHPEHPQTARVFVNRVWLHLFGRGIVPTPDDLGVYGAKPTHPELLDHLANRFVNDGWSLKRLVRSIVLSRTYQLGTAASENLVQADPENTFYARHSRRRLDAESLRDSILQATGRIDFSRPVGSFIDDTDALINKPPGNATNYHQPSQHRSVYLCMLRNAPPPELAAFDLPDGIAITGQRNVTTLPTQSLFLFNNPFVISQAEHLAKSTLSKDEWDHQRKVQAIFQSVLIRNPDESELRQTLEFVNRIQSRIDSDNKQQELKAWTSFVQALIATNEFRYID